MAAAYGELAHLYALHDMERARPTTDPDRLQVAAQQALAIDPQQVTALDALALMYILRNEDDIAYFYALKVLAVAPHDPGALLILGGVYGNSGLLDDALATFRKAGETDPLYLYPMTNAAEALVMLGRLDEAWQEIESAKAIEPDNYGVLRKQAWIRYHQGRLDEAEQIILYATPRVAAGEQAPLEIIQAWIYSRRGLHEQAQALLNKVKDSPLVRKSLDLQMWLAEGWSLENAPDKSVPLLITVGIAHPNYPWFMRNENLQPVRGNPAFDKLLSDLKAQWEKNRAKFRSSSDVLHASAT
jgi:tetratricopeptide (TPR) repeat protein